MLAEYAFMNLYQRQQIADISRHFSTFLDISFSCLDNDYDYTLAYKV